MTVKVPVITVLCDGEGCDAEHQGFYTKKKMAARGAEREGWYSSNTGNDYCPDCAEEHPQITDEMLEERAEAREMLR